MIDGNKRLGWLATAVFLDLNGINITNADNDDVYDLVIDVAAQPIEVAALKSVSARSSATPDQAAVRQRTIPKRAWPSPST